jgi:hypothetical protein
MSPISRTLASPKLATPMDEAEDVPAFMHFPRQAEAAVDQSARTPQQGSKGRRAVVGILPNEAGIIRLAGAVLLEQNDEWQPQHRYLTLETIAGLAGDEGRATDARHQGCLIQEALMTTSATYITVTDVTCLGGGVVA